MSGAGHSPVGGGGGSVPVCVCALFMGHIGYISLKTKNIIFLSLFSFIIKVFAKTRNYKKNHSLFQLCTLRPRRLISVSLQAAAFSPSLGSFLRATPGRSCILEVHSGPPNLKVVPASIHAYIWIYIENRSCLHIWLWGSKRGSDVSAETRDAPQVRYQVLKLFAGWFLTLFQSHFRLASFNETITIACAVCFCAIVPEKPAFCSTLDLNQREEGEVEPSGRDGWPGPSLRRALGFHQHWEAPPSPTPSSALLSTCLVLEITSSPPPSDFLRFIIVILSHTDSKATGARVKSTQSWISWGSGGKKSWISKSLKTKVWVEYAHASSYTGYNQAYICGCMCVYG